jgi:hypothetical protein
MLATTLSGRLGHDMMYMSTHASDGAVSHAADGAAGVTWSWHDVDAESCW